MINWGIIGCGKVTEVKSGPAFNKVKDSRLVAVMRRNRELAEDYARRHKVPKVYSEAGELINDSDIDAVYVATPPGSHAEYAIAAIKAGKPVYIEKPMAVNYAECQKINDEAKKHNVPVFVAYYRRALPGFLMVKDLIEKGSIGKVRFVQLQLFKSPSDDELGGRLPWRVDPALAGGGHFFDLGCHTLDWLDYVFGPVRDINSIVLNQGGLYEAEDFVTTEFRMDDDVIGTGTWCFNASHDSSRDSIEIIGDRGTISFSSFTYVPIVLKNATGTSEFINEQPEHVQQNLINKIVQSLHGNGESPSNGITAARTARVMDEIVAEYYKGHRA
ncbi:MAG TPA: Gfo/Idh/MocA family oxidoreductase [Bacteroidales bacterium]|nr:Gfo/Idh/MocA family oxidoreductase [Bacteroidales bacterium]